MAHGDYDCCAICDRKLRYVGMDAATKDEMCSDCLKALRDQNVNALDPKEFLEWADGNEPEKVRSVLEAVGFRYCIYPNPFDALVAYKIGIDAVLSDADDMEKARVFYGAKITEAAAPDPGSAQGG